MPFVYDEFDASGIRTYALSSRKSKARVDDFAQSVGTGATVAQLLALLPRVLAVADFLNVVSSIGEAMKRGL